MRRLFRNPPPEMMITVVIVFFLCLVAWLTSTGQTVYTAAVSVAEGVATEKPIDLQEVATTTPVTPTPLQPTLFDYIEVTDSCGPYFEGACVNARGGAGKQYPIITRLRTGVVLKTSGTVMYDGKTWYKITFDEWLRYPDRVSSDFYVIADYVTPFRTLGSQEIPVGTGTSTTKRILIDRSDQMLSAYDGDTLFMQEKISTGLEFTPTPRGIFTIFRKTPSRYMQGPIPDISEKIYDLPGVPWNLYFTEQGAAIHGAYWHDHFGEQWSSGCVNLPLQKAKSLYLWADLGTKVTVRD